MSTPELHPRCSADLCVRCRKKLQPGDRVTIAHIVERTGPNPDNRLQVVAWLSGEFEITHVDCTDRGLNGRMIAL